MCEEKQWILLMESWKKCNEVGNRFREHIFYEGYNLRNNQHRKSVQVFMTQ